MKPVQFAYERPSDIPDALALGSRDDITVKYIAGGQSLGPMLNLRLVQPDLIVDLTAIAELKRFDADSNSITIGACVTHADIEDERVPDVTNGALASVARNIAYRAVRNRGTIGGSLTHADPAADWMSCLSALGATIITRGNNGTREIPIENFMIGVFETGLTHGEMVVGVRIPRLYPTARFGYFKACRKTGEFAHAIGAVLHDRDRGICRAVMGATGSRPILVSEAGALFEGGFNQDTAHQALQSAGVTDAIDVQMHVAALRRAADKARVT